MRLLRLAVVLLAFSACGGGDDGDDDNTDGNTLIDAPMADAAIDAPPGTACTGVAYDPCTDNTQCMSGNCHLYLAQSLQVCVTTCTPGNNATCPVDSSGANGFCNNMGICRPAAANNCTR